MILIEPESSSKIRWRTIPGATATLDLTPEPHNSNISDERLERAGIDQAAINFLRDQKVELNSMTSRQLVDFVEDQLKQHGISKVIPGAETLARAYEMFTMSDRLSKAFDDLKEQFDEDQIEAPIKVPKDLDAQIRKQLKQHQNITWHRAVQLVIDPDSPDDEDDEDDGE
jgi:hypothetical protein